MFYLNSTKFTMEVPSTQMRAHSKFEKIPSTVSKIQARKLLKEIMFFSYPFSFCKLNKK